MKKLIFLFILVGYYIPTFSMELSNFCKVCEETDYHNEYVHLNKAQSMLLTKPFEAYEEVQNILNRVKPDSNKQLIKFAHSFKTEIIKAINDIRIFNISNIYEKYEKLGSLKITNKKKIELFKKIENAIIERAIENDPLAIEFLKIHLEIGIKLKKLRLIPNNIL